MKLIRSHNFILVSILGFLVLLAPALVFATEPSETTWFQGLIYALVTTITGWFLGIGGLILNYGINDFLLGFGNTFGDTGIGVAVDSTWTTIRDFVNMSFIFGLVYIGFKMILNSNDSQTKRWLANLVLAALLINFSLFISKTIIEVSNQFAIQIVKSGFTYKTMPNGNIEVNMSATLQDKLGITTIWSQSATDSRIPIGANGDNAWGYIFGTGILFLITGFVYAAGGILLIIRFAILNFYMVLSPVLFLGWILPPLSGTLSKYWGQFLSKCFFAPVYILMLYFSFRILDGMQATGKYQPDWVGVAANSGQSITVAGQSTIPFFILTCFFLIGSLIIAQRMGAEGASKALSIGRNISSRANKFTQRQTLGRGARVVGAVSNNAEKNYRRMDARLSTIKNPVLRGAARATVAAGTLGLATESGAEIIGKGKNLSVAGSETYSQRKDRDKKVRIRQSQELKTMENERRFGQANGVLAGTKPGEYKDTDGNVRPPTEQLEEAIKELGKSIRDMTDEERADLGKDELTKKGVALNLSDKHIESLEKSGEYSHADIQEIKKARKDARIDVANGNVQNTDTNGNPSSGGFIPSSAGSDTAQKIAENLKADLLKGSTQDVGNLPKEVFMSEGMAKLITPQMLEQRMRNGDLTNDELGRIRENIQNLVNATNSQNDQEVRLANTWKKWSDGNSVYGAQFGLDVSRIRSSQNNAPQSQNPNLRPGETVSPGGIITPLNVGNGPRQN